MGVTLMKLSRKLRWSTLWVMVFGLCVWAQNPPWRDPNFDTAKYDFTIKTIDGKQVQLSSFKGKVVLLNLWATWCGPCRIETPGFVSVYERLRKAGDVVFLAVAIWDEEPAVREFVKDYKVSYLVANDSDDTVAKLYRAQAIPETYLITPDGKLSYRFEGLTPAQELETRIKALLAVPRSTKE